MELASISTYRKDIFGVYVFGQNGGRYKSNYYSFKSEDQRETTWYRTIAGSREATWFPSHEGSFIVRSSISDNFITVGQPVMDKASGMVNGIVAADIKEDVITQKIKHSLSNGVICIIDQGEASCSAPTQATISTIPSTFPPAWYPIFWNPQALPWENPW